MPNVKTRVVPSLSPNFPAKEITMIHTTISMFTIHEAVIASMFNDYRMKGKFAFT